MSVLKLRREMGQMLPLMQVGVVSGAGLPHFPEDLEPALTQAAQGTGVIHALLALAKELVVVDLSAVGYIDSAGVRALDRGLGAVVSRGGTFRAVAPMGGAARLTLRVSGYELLFADSYSGR